MKTYAFFICVLACYSLFGQVNTKDISIYRDSYGVPHVYAPTDEAAAYGLAWAHAEDDFKTIQYTFLPSKGLMGMHSGKEGVIMDYLVALLRCRETAEKNKGSLAI